MAHSRPTADDAARNPLRLRRDQWIALTRTFAPLMILLAVTAPLADAATFAIGIRLGVIG